MQKLIKSMEIKATADKVYEYITEPTNLPGIWPNMIEVTNVEKKADGSHSFDWKYKMAGLHFKGHAESKKVEKPSELVVENTGIPSTFKWTFTSKGSVTDVKLEVEYSIPTPVLGKFAELIVHKMNERDAENLLLNLKTAVEALTFREAGTYAHA